jgi:hypothetical protein
MDPAVVGRRHLIIVILDANGNVLRSTHTDSGKRISLADLADFGQRNSVAGRAERAAWVAEHEAQSAARRRELRDTEDRLEVFAGDLRQRLTDAGIGPEHVELSHDGATVKLPTWALLTLLP